MLGWSDLDSILFSQDKLTYLTRPKDASSLLRCLEIINVFEDLARKLVQEMSDETGQRGLDRTELGQVNTILVIARASLIEVRILIKKKGLIIIFELLENLSS